MEAIPKSDIKSDIRFGTRFDIRIKQTTWIGQVGLSPWLLSTVSLAWIHRIFSA